MKKYGLYLALFFCIVSTNETIGSITWLSAKVKQNGDWFKVRLTYITPVIPNYKKFYLQKATNENGPWVEVETFIPNSAGVYIWDDNDVPANRYWYRIRNDLWFGSDTYSNVQDVPIHAYQIVILSEDEIHCHDNEVREVFFDGFQGAEVDPEKWMKVDPNGNTGNINDYTFTNPDNANCIGGELVIETKRDHAWHQIPPVEWGDSLSPTYEFEYSTGSIQTNQKWSHGIFLAEIKIEEGPGYWPAFWLWGKRPETGGQYQPDNELDIFEFWNEKKEPEWLWQEINYDKQNKELHATVHYGEDFTSESINNDIDYSQDYHIFQARWDEYKIQWIVDDNIIRTLYHYLDSEGDAVECSDLIAGTPYIKYDIYPVEAMTMIIGSNVAVHKADEYQPSHYFPPEDHDNRFLKVKWVKIYNWTNFNKDLKICDNDLVPDEYQLITGKEIRLSSGVNCGFIIDPTNEVDVLSSQKIVLEKGFHAKNGSRFTANIESTTKTLDTESNNLFNNTNTAEMEMLDMQDTALSIEYLKIYPNPTIGNLRIELVNTNDLTISSCKIVDMKGNILKHFKNVNSDYLEIDFTLFAKGTYFMETYSHQKMFKNKIIYK